MTRTFIVRVLTEKEGLDHSAPEVKGYIKGVHLIPSLYKFEYRGSREQAVKNAIRIIAYSEGIRLKQGQYDIIDPNALNF